MHEEREGAGGPAEYQVGDFDALVSGREEILWEPMDDLRPNVIMAQGD